VLTRVDSAPVMGMCFFPETMDPTERCS